MAEISFGFIDRRVVAAVERVAGTDPDPGDPFRGLYISDEVALRLTQGDSGSGDLPGYARVPLAGDIPERHHRDRRHGRGDEHEAAQHHDQPAQSLGA